MKYRHNATSSRQNAHIRPDHAGIDAEVVYALTGAKEKRHRLTRWRLEIGATLRLRNHVRYFADLLIPFAINAVNFAVWLNVKTHAIVFDLDADSNLIADTRRDRRDT